MRSTLPEAEAARPALARARLPVAVRSEVRERSAGARARAETLVRRVVREPVTAKPTPAAHGVPPVRAEALPAAGAAGRCERGEDRDERGA